VAILDADKEGFLRSRTSLVQTAGRAARNMAGRVILYADEMTDSMAAAIRETTRRREIQLEHNRTHGITPETIRKTREEILRTTSIADVFAGATAGGGEGRLSPESAPELPADPAEAAALLESLMLEAASRLEFEVAAGLRDRLRALTGERSGKPGRGSGRPGTGSG
ncbi:UvrB/UvrC motif-containing protein, partial [Candidatus Fermentibacterales bacterium]|nr:UvrB/UvrC motif-containing protein [Candidatus Fermentibacterales bacterium]